MLTISLDFNIVFLLNVSLERFHTILLLLLFKKVGSARLGQKEEKGKKTEPIDRKKRKLKRVEDYSRDRAA